MADETPTTTSKSRLEESLPAWGKLAVVFMREYGAPGVAIGALIYVLIWGVPVAHPERVEARDLTSAVSAVQASIDGHASDTAQMASDLATQKQAAQSLEKKVDLLNSYLREACVGINKIAKDPDGERRCWDMERRVR